MKTSLEAALEFHRRGWQPLNIPQGQKETYEKGWQHLRLTEDDIRQRFGSNQTNLALQLGEASHGLIDIDLDVREARVLAPHILPRTGAVFGRKSAPHSHRLYITDPLANTLKFHDVDGKTLVELRSSNHLTVVPPSVHPSGETVEWYQEEEPSKVDGRELAIQVGRLAAATLLARHWPGGSRHDAALALAGALLRGNWEPEEAQDFIVAVAQAAGDEEAAKRGSVVAGTKAKLDKGEAVTGWPRLTEYLGEKVVERLRKWLDMAHASAIIGTSRQLPDVTADAMRALVMTNEPPTTFIRSGHLVRVVEDEQGRSQLEMLDSAMARGILARSADWLTVLKDGHPKAIPPPQEVVSDFLTLGAWPQIPPLIGLVNGPVMTKGGHLLDTPGYHPPSGLLYIGDKLDMPTLSVKQSVTLLVDDLLGDFPFDGDASCANTLALMVTLAVRPALAGPVPLFVADSPTPGTGKSLMADVIATPSDPHGAAVMAPGRDEEEWRKRLTTILLTGKRYVLLDNVTQKLTSGALAGAITAWPDWEDRLLGSNTMVRVPNLTVFVATGNNLTFSQELVRRSVWIRLIANAEQPWLRTDFKHKDLRAWATKNRRHLASAVMTLVGAWLDAGQPHWKGLPPGSFEKWARVVGGILDVAGVKGFLGNAKKLYEKLDPEREAWVGFVEAWAKQFKSEPVTVKALLEWAPDDLLDGIVGSGGKQADDSSRRVRLGLALAGRVDRIYGKWQIRREGKAHNNVMQYNVAPLKANPPRSRYGGGSTGSQTTRERGENGNAKLRGF